MMLFVIVANFNGNVMFTFHQKIMMKKKKSSESVQMKFTFLIPISSSKALYSLMVICNVK